MGFLDDGDDGCVRLLPKGWGALDPVYQTDRMITKTVDTIDDWMDDTPPQEKNDE